MITVRVIDDPVRLRTGTTVRGAQRTSELVNDSDFQTGEQVVSAVAGEASLRKAADAGIKHIAETAFVKRVAIGDVAAFDDGADHVPVTDLTVELPYKSGGYTGCTVTRTGKNLVDIANQSDIAVGTLRSNTLAAFSAIRYEENTQYTISFDLADVVEPGNRKFGVSVMYVGYETLQYLWFYEDGGVSASSRTTDAGKTVSSLAFCFDDNANFSLSISNVMVERGSAKTDYVPYVGQTYTTDWTDVAGTIYGGTWDVTSGVLTSILDENSDPLPTPITYQLTPVEVTTLLGDNVLSTDTGDVTVTYRADPGAVADGKVDKVQGKGLSTNDYTDAEKEKLEGIAAGAEVNNVFMAVYGVTTYGEIVTAQQAGKTVLLRYGSIILSASKADSSDILFTGVYFYEGNDHATRLLVCSVNSNSVWSEAARFLEWETHKVTTMGASSTDIQYPSAKAVYDALQERLAKNDANARIVPGYGGSAVYGTDYDGVEPSAGMKAFCFSAYQEIKPALWPTGNADVSIGTAEELIAFAISSQTDNYAGRKVVLTADIDLNPGWIAGSSAPEQAWTPIGNIDTRFNGTFDGQGHTISGVYLNATEKYQGLFGCTGEDAIIQNFKLKNSYFTSTGDQLGSIAGYASGLFEKIYSESIVYGKSNYVGGLIGTNAYRSIVVMNDCWFAGSVTMNAAKSYLGGLIGGVQTGAYEASGANINNCLNTGEVAHKYTGSLNTAATGGFVGTAQGAVTINNSVNHTNPSYQRGSGNGLFVGYGSGAVTLTNCHAINHGGKHLVNGVDDDLAAYPTCTRQNLADVAGTKSITVAKVQNLFLSDGAQGHWVCSVDSLPVLADFTGYLRRFELSDGNNAVSPDQPIPAGSDISIKAGYSASFAGIIIAGLTTSSTEVIVQLYRDYPSNWAPANHLNAPSSGYLWFPSYPDAGVIEKGNGASTLGEGNKANEEGAFAAGRNNIADGRYSAAFGDNNKVGYAGAAFGNDNEVYGILSVAAGIGNRIIGAHSVALGYYNEVSGDSACAFGHGNKATADHAQAFGWQTKAAGANSYTEGLGTHAIQFCQHARGKFNVEDRDGLYADIVGWGTADNARKNISALKTDGTLILKGGLTLGANDDSTGGVTITASQLQALLNLLN